MVTKVYSCNFPYFSIYVNVDGKDVKVVFKGSYSAAARLGECRTSDAAIQEALEKHPQYGIRFHLIQTIEEEDVPAANKPKRGRPFANKVVADTTTNVFTDKYPADGDTMVVEDVKTYQAAKEWLIKERGIMPDVINNADDLRNIAKELHLDFVDWK
jgi:hypothetical protein